MKLYEIQWQTCCHYCKAVGKSQTPVYSFAFSAHIPTKELILNFLQMPLDKQNYFRKDIYILGGVAPKTKFILCFNTYYMNFY